MTLVVVDMVVFETKDNRRNSHVVVSNKREEASIMFIKLICFVSSLKTLFWSTTHITSYLTWNLGRVKKDWIFTKCCYNFVETREGRGEGEQEYWFGEEG